MHDANDFVVIHKPTGVQVGPTVDNLLENVLACTAQVPHLPSIFHLTVLGSELLNADIGHLEHQQQFPYFLWIVHTAIRMHHHAQQSSCATMSIFVADIRAIIAIILLQQDVTQRAYALITC